MGQNTNIEWCDYTFNPWEGCTKVSPGCAHCYAEARNRRFAGGANWGPGAPRRRTDVANWKQPLRWNAEWANIDTRAALAGVAPHRPRVFCASLADWLDDEVPIEWLADLLDLIRRTPNLDWLLLTKRPQNWQTRMDEAAAFAVMSPKHHALLPWLVRWSPFYGASGGGPGSPVSPENIWIGTTVEDQQRAGERIPILLRIPAKVRFLSCEPLLRPVNLSAGFDGPQTFPLGRGINWIIVGGESGPGARPLFIEWADDLRRQCAKADVAFFMKQLGAQARTENANAHDWPDHAEFRDDGASGTAFAACRVVLKNRKGGDMEEFPSELQVREFPGVRP